MKKIFLSSILFGVTSLFLFSSCDRDNSEVESVVEDFIEAAKNGDVDCGREYCRGYLRDIELKSRVQMAAIAINVSSEAVENGESDSEEDFVQDRLDHYATVNAYHQAFENVTEIGPPEDYPNYGDVCKIVPYKCNGSSHIFVVVNFEDGWYIVESREPFNEGDYSEQNYKDIVSHAESEYFTDRSIYDTDTDLDAQFFFNYVNRGELYDE